MSGYYRTSKNSGVSFGLIGGFFVLMYVIVKWLLIIGIALGVWVAHMAIIAGRWSIAEWDKRQLGRTDK
jgi:hypothetical protein